MSSIKITPNNQLGIDRLYKNYQDLLIFAVQMLIFYMALYSFNRSLFYVWNKTAYHSLSQAELVKIFMAGFRFDFVVCAPIVLMLSVSLLILSFKIWRYVFWFLTAAHGVLLFFNFIDVELVNFTGRRFSKTLFYLIGEGSASNLVAYTGLTVTTFACLLGYVFLSRFFFFKAKQIQVQKNTLLQTLIVFLCLVFLVVSARGGLQEKPISFVDSKVVDHPLAQNLVLNTSFSLIKSFGQKKFESIKAFSEQEMLTKVNPISPTVQNSPFSDYNLVLIVLESFSSEYVQKGYAPFLSSFQNKGPYFLKAYANGRRSVEGIASVITSIPALMDEPFINSEFSNTNYIGLGQLLKNKNYHTSFFHGGKNGTFRFDQFTKTAGFDHYYGMNEYPDKNDYDGAWGIYDEPFLQFMCQKLDQFPKPFASMVFTLSSHQPFKIPDQFQSRLPITVETQKHPVLRTISYTDIALQNFFDCVQSKNWFKKTLFVFVADHTGPVVSDDSSFSARYEIPLIFYSPDLKVSISENQLAQQIDILPTLNDLMGLGMKSQNRLSHSLVTAEPKKIVLYSDQKYELVTDDPLALQNKDLYLLALKQYYSEGLYKNLFFRPLFKEIK